MDRLIKRFDVTQRGDLSFTEKGIAYQPDMSKRVPYDEAYFKKCAGYDGTEIENKINTGRIALIEKHYKGNVLDIGIGSGEFIRRRTDTFGIDVNPKALGWLRRTERLAYGWEYGAFTMWDVIEHVEAPEEYLRRMKRGSWLFASIPVFKEMVPLIRESKHYRPDEHLYYFTEKGFAFWLGLYGFRLVQKTDFETKAGREDIMTFVFKRDLPLAKETLIQYQKLHEERNYGSSSWLYLDLITEAVKRLQPTSVLDYGCGQSDLVCHFYLDGKRKIGKYDPAIKVYRDRPEPGWDLILCNDVMEHINMVNVDAVLDDIRSLGKKVIFTISMVPARAKLPDGRNAHVTLLNADEWTRWISEYFKVQRVQTQWDHILMLVS